MGNVSKMVRNTKMALLFDKPDQLLRGGGSLDVNDIYF